ncbi:hypothetical protein J6590_097125 [Homalodisca vitripennis]|nr:hypothetical protein J6590_097125 [Homalodisca vitripennis]
MFQLDVLREYTIFPHISELSSQLLSHLSLRLLIELRTRSKTPGFCLMVSIPLEMFNRSSSMVSIGEEGKSPKDLSPVLLLAMKLANIGLSIDFHRVVRRCPVMHKPHVSAQMQRYNQQAAWEEARIRLNDLLRFQPRHLLKTDVVGFRFDSMRISVCPSVVVMELMIASTPLPTYGQVVLDNLPQLGPTKAEYKWGFLIIR